MKTRIITWVVTLGALLDTIYGVFCENSGLLADLGVSPKVTKIVLLSGIIWTAFSKSLAPKTESISKFSEGEGDGKVVPDKAPIE